MRLLRAVSHTLPSSQSFVVSSTCQGATSQATHMSTVRTDTTVKKTEWKEHYKLRCAMGQAESQPCTCIRSAVAKSPASMAAQSCMSFVAALLDTSPVLSRASRLPSLRLLASNSRRLAGLPAGPSSAEETSLKTRTSVVAMGFRSAAMMIKNATHDK